MITQEYVHIKGRPEKMVLFLHGYGEDAKDTNDAITALLDSLDNCVVLIPSSPQACENPSKKRQWYSISDFDPDKQRRKSQDFSDVVKIYSKSNKSMKEGFAILTDYIEEKLKEYGLKYKDLYVCGFSQGASLSLYAGLMLKEKVAGIISFSGILCPHHILIDVHKNNANVLLIHGKADDIIKFDALEFSKTNLEKMNCTVSTYAIEGISHSITEDGLLMASSFINAKK